MGVQVFVDSGCCFATGGHGTDNEAGTADGIA